ncbi:hypothetical protein GCM10017772_23980 [Promicromonospora soli]|uniref:Uncharacterized protein n=1 Tax=Promicromonospora soli TaxID=2035533 RepID=A0A919FVP0_9MICO|nr:hypothetical protein GCM10017772_23980 [Promicromonospora soli]
MLLDDAVHDGADVVGVGHVEAPDAGPSAVGPDAGGYRLQAVRAPCAEDYLVALRR